jgi:hypothetical protein
LIAHNEQFDTFHNDGKTEKFDIRNPVEKTLIESVMELEDRNTSVLILAGEKGMKIS